MRPVLRSMQPLACGELAWIIGCQRRAHAEDLPTPGAAPSVPQYYRTFSTGFHRNHLLHEKEHFIE